MLIDFLFQCLDSSSTSEYSQKTWRCMREGKLCWSVRWQTKQGRCNGPRMASL